ncbi:hypothetical protein ABPG74_013053 [Tetrahymena malaccensis]
MKYIVLLLIIAILTVKANQKLPQCYNDLMQKVINNEICQKGDTDCIAALASLDNCSLNCSSQNKSQQPQTFNCIKNNCKSTNPTAQAYLDDLVKCADPYINNRSILIFSIITVLIFSLI